MKKQKQDQKQVQQGQAQEVQAQEGVDLSQYGYAPGTLIPVPAELFMGVMSILQRVVQRETKEVIEVVTFEIGKQEDVSHKETFRLLTTPLGKESGDLFNEYLQLHGKNTESGLAVKHNPAVELDLGAEPNDESK